LKEETTNEKPLKKKVTMQEDNESIVTATSPD